MSRGGGCGLYLDMSTFNDPGSRAIASVILGLYATACGEVLVTSPDAGDPGGGPVTLTSTTPADGAHSVDVLAPLVLTFSGERTPPAVHVFERSSRREVPVADAAWDSESHTLTVTLVRPLAFATEHRIESDGFPTFRFRTYINQDTSVKSYDTAGNISTTKEVMLAADGFADTAIAKDASGVITTQDDWDYRADGELVRRVTRDATGKVTNWQAHELAEPGVMRNLSYNGPGVDGIWLNADDRISYTVTTTYDDKDRHAVQIMRSDAGEIRTRTVYTYTNDLALLTMYVGAGPDTIWGTTDDVVSATQRNTYDETGQLVEVRAMNAAGDTTTRNTYGYDAATHQLTSIKGYQPGPDGVWDTSDDQPRTMYTIGYDAQHRRNRYDGYDAGPDGIANTTDDRLVMRYGFTSEL